MDRPWSLTQPIIDHHLQMIAAWQSVAPQRCSRKKNTVFVTNLILNPLKLNNGYHRVASPREDVLAKTKNVHIYLSFSRLKISGAKTHYPPHIPPKNFLGTQMYPNIIKLWTGQQSKLHRIVLPPFPHRESCSRNKNTFNCYLLSKLTKNHRENEGGWFLGRENAVRWSRMAWGASPQWISMGLGVFAQVCICVSLRLCSGVSMWLYLRGLSLHVYLCANARGRICPCAWNHHHRTKAPYLAHAAHIKWRLKLSMCRNKFEL